MTSYNFGDIVLVTFPFSDLKSLKKRPSVVISSKKFNNFNDIIIMAISGNIVNDYYQNAIIRDWKASGLIKESIFKPVVATIENNLIIKQIGKLSDHDTMSLVYLLKNIIDLG